MTTRYSRIGNASLLNNRSSRPLAMAFALAIIVGTIGCQQEMARVDDALLPDAPAGHMVVVRQARVDRDTAKDNHARARRNIQVCMDQMDLARSEINVATTQLNDAKLSLDMARKHETAYKVGVAEAQYQNAKAKVATTRMLIPVRELEIEHAKLVEALSAEQVQLALAEVELAKANAVKASGRSEGNKITLGVFQRQVDARKQAVASAQAKVNQAAQDVELARQKYEAHRTGNR